MDLLYMPEVLGYSALRLPQYRDYEQPWNEDYFNYGKSTTMTRSHQQRQQVEKPSTNTPCPFCKENKRRTLAAYIRGKARNKSCSDINEEVDEKDEEIEKEREKVTRTVEKEEEPKSSPKDDCERQEDAKK